MVQYRTGNMQDRFKDIAVYVVEWGPKFGDRWGPNMAVLFQFLCQKIL